MGINANTKKDPLITPQIGMNKIFPFDVWITVIACLLARNIRRVAMPLVDYLPSLAFNKKPLLDPPMTQAVPFSEPTSEDRAGISGED